MTSNPSSSSAAAAGAPPSSPLAGPSSSLTSSSSLSSSCSSSTTIASPSGSSRIGKPPESTKPPSTPAKPLEQPAARRRPLPPRPPPVWAESRQELCESLAYFRAYQSGCYALGPSPHSARLVSLVRAQSSSSVPSPAPRAHASAAPADQQNASKGASATTAAGRSAARKDSTAFAYLLGAYGSRRDAWAHQGRVVISHGGGKAGHRTGGAAAAATTAMPPEALASVSAEQGSGGAEADEEVADVGGMPAIQQAQPFNDLAATPISVPARRLHGPRASKKVGSRAKKAKKSSTAASAPATTSAPAGTSTVVAGQGDDDDDDDDDKNEEADEAEVSMPLLGDQAEHQSAIAALLDAHRNWNPVVLVAAEEYPLLDFRLPCAYAVLGWYHVTDCWAERETAEPASHVDGPSSGEAPDVAATTRERHSAIAAATAGFVRWKFRFEWLESQGEPWWLPQGDQGWVDARGGEEVAGEERGWNPRARTEMVAHYTARELQAEKSPGATVERKGDEQRSSTNSLVPPASASRQDRLAEFYRARPLANCAPRGGAVTRVELRRGTPWPEGKSDEVHICAECGASSPRVYASRPMCLRSGCASFWKIDGRPPDASLLGFQPSFLRSRASSRSRAAIQTSCAQASGSAAATLSPDSLPPPFSLQPPQPDPEAAWGTRSEMAGLHCLRCHRVSCRQDAHGWRCAHCRHLVASCAARFEAPTATPRADGAATVATSTAASAAAALAASSSSCFSSAWSPEESAWLHPRGGVEVHLRRLPALGVRVATYTMPACFGRAKVHVVQRLRLPCVDERLEHDGKQGGASSGSSCNSGSSRSGGGGSVAETVPAGFERQDGRGERVPEEELGLDEADAIFAEMQRAPKPLLRGPSALGASESGPTNVGHTRDDHAAADDGGACSDQKGNQTHRQLEWTNSAAVGNDVDEDDEMLDWSDVVRFRRHPLSNHQMRGTLLSQQFTFNYGEKYKHSVEMDTVPLSQAPGCARRALDLLSRYTEAATTLPAPFNELYPVRYAEGQRMNYHDDGEPGLGPVVSSLSLGVTAEMSFRLKAKYTRKRDSGCGQAKDQASSQVHVKSEVCDAKADVDLDEEEGASSDEALSHASARRRRLRFEAQCAALRQERTMLRVALPHGAVCVQEGASLQTYFEHRVQPRNECAGPGAGGIRVALTARRIDVVEAKRAKRVRRGQCSVDGGGGGGRNSSSAISEDAATRAPKRRATEASAPGKGKDEDEGAMRALDDKIASCVAPRRSAKAKRRPSDAATTQATARMTRPGPTVRARARAPMARSKLRASLLTRAPPGGWAGERLTGSTPGGAGCKDHQVASQLGLTPGLSGATPLSSWSLSSTAAENDDLGPGVDVERSVEMAAAS